jgi:hypothetical protein
MPISFAFALLILFALRLSFYATEAGRQHFAVSKRTIQPTPCSVPRGEHCDWEVLTTCVCFVCLQDQLYDCVDLNRCHPCPAAHVRSGLSYSPCFLCRNFQNFNSLLRPGDLFVAPGSNPCTSARPLRVVLLLTRSVPVCLQATTTVRCSLSSRRSIVPSPPTPCV